MKTTLLLEKGEIVLGSKAIIIRDRAKKEKVWRVASAAIWIIYGTLSYLRYKKTGDEFLLWSGLIIGVLHAVGLIFALLKCTKREISLQEIGMAVFKERNGKKFLDLKLNGGRKRRISKIESVVDELKAFFMAQNIEVR
ncbi:hypothetical protein [Pontibacter oryzae]|uniref:Uncharacterized protein n=1 Tax=Pontibacter oryzae TaxID=2304593 RepID=A0A399RUE7_9BACT|nr:hypothetical protein [Pontibacter oryzae]RIJ33953.1 hypothetical protein D1627_16370 [Pontibacter oryzae]